MSINALCNRGDNILIAKPSFPLTKPICDNIGVEIRYYALDSDHGWQINLPSVEKLIDSRTKAFLVVNPSNPCSTVFSKQH